MTLFAQKSDRESTDPGDAQSIGQAKIDCSIVMRQS
jgi:hypothetical protein